jgi:2'-5' RNA ligase
VRLFIAINLPDALRRAIYEAAAPLRRPALPIKWVNPDGLHLTLKFLGSVEAGRLAEIEQAVSRACRGAKPFNLPVGGFGAFPGASRPRVVWVGCEAVPALELLQHAVEREFAELGFAIDGRPFRPHLTLGRARPDARGLGVLEPLLSEAAFEDAVAVGSVDVMESVPGPQGSRYTMRHSVALAG